MRVAVFCILVLAVPLGGALADTHYVSWSGNMTAPYTSWETAAWFVTQANEASSDGDTIFIDAGDFYLSEWIKLKPKVTLRGKGMDSTRVYGSEKVSEMISVDDSSVVEDIHFIGNGASGAINNFAVNAFEHFIRCCRFSNFVFDAVSLHTIIAVTVRDCWFESFGYSALTLHNYGDHRIENCTFYMPVGGMWAVDLEYNYGEVVFRHNIVVGCRELLYGPASRGSWEVTNNLFYRNTQLWRAFGTSATELLVLNNSLYVVHDDGDPTGFINSGNPEKYGLGPRLCQISNNAVWMLRPQFTFFNGISPDDRIEISYNCFYSIVPWQNYAGVQFPDTYFQPLDPDTCPQIDWVGNIFTDPMYVDPENGDLHLQYGSPCIDAGHPDILDLDGTRSDIGAFGGPDGEFYIYQDLPPKTPGEFTLEESGNSIRLSWKPNSESDLYQYILFRSEYSGVPVDSEHVLVYIRADSLEYSGSAARTEAALDSGLRQNDKVLQSAVLDSYAERRLGRLGKGLGGATRLADCDSGYICYTDSAVQPQQSYFYTIIAIDQSILASEAAEEVGVLFTDVADNEHLSLPEAVRLEQNYPNPFNACTAIVYKLPNIGSQPAPVRLTIYNTLGQVVKTLVDTRQNPGEHIAYWDGSGEHGRTVASGVYFYTLNVSGLDFARTRKLLLLK